MIVLIIDNGTTLLEKLKALVNAELLVRTWTDVTPEDVAQAQVLVLSGGSRMQLQGNENLFANEIDLITKSGKPVVGICFGCELITEAFGGTLKHLDSPHKGIRTVTVFGNGSEAEKNIRVYENHQWMIDTLPPGFTAIAASEQGPEAIKHDSLPIWGIQFHPENLVDETEGDEFFHTLFDTLVSA